MGTKPTKVSIAEAELLDKEKWAVAVLYSDKSMNINVLGTRYSMAHNLKNALEEEDHGRKNGDKEIRVVLINRASIKFTELK